MENRPKVGPFDVHDELGRGGMSRVYRAEYRRTGASAALKIVTPERARRENFRRSFRREVHALASLDHPGIARVYDYGTIPPEVAEEFGDEVPAGAPWFALEHVGGVSLPTWPGSWTWTDVRDLLVRLLDALAHAHARGIIHRDLKPSNVLAVEADADDDAPAVKVVDFGIARLVRGGTEGDVPAEHDSITGTPKYMAPEQIRGNWRDQGPWTDLYSVGCLCWRLLTGRPPFVSDDSTEVLRAHLQSGLPELNPKRPVPGEMEEWLRRLLEKSPGERFDRAADAAYALRQMEPPAEPAVGTTDDRDSDRDASVATTLVTSSSRDWDATRPEEGTGSSSVREGEGAPPSGGADEVDPPPTPEDWRRGGRDRRVESLERAGLNLFPLRTIPVVDRQEERDRLWSDLRRVAERRSPGATILGGVSGLGKSRLAAWLVRRAHELGVANPIRVSHRRLGAPGAGLGEMLRRKFQCYDLEYDDAVSRIRRLLQRRFGVPGDVVLHDAALVANLVFGGLEEEARPGRFHGPRQRRLALVRWLANYGRNRPVVMWLDDAHWGRESLALMRRIFRERANFELPVYTVVTVDTDAEGIDSGAEEVLDGLAERPEVRASRIGPLGEGAQKDLVEQLLEFDSQTAERLASATEGHPLYAVQSVTDWVERDALAVTDSGIELDGELDEQLPEEPDAVWARRVETALEMADVETERAQRCLEAAAVLGSEIREEEWRAVCRRLGVEVVDEVRGALLSRGLFEHVGDRVAFVHAGLRDRLTDQARRGDRLVETHRVCAETLAELYGDRPPRGRVGMHRLYAGEPQRAMEPARRAARRAYRQRRYDDAGYYLDVWRAAAAALGLDEQDREWLNARLLGAEIALGIGDAERARRLIGGVRNRAREMEWRREEGRATTIAGRLLVNRGRLQEGRQRLRRAIDLLADVGDDRGRAHAHLSLAEVAKRLGEFEVAREQYNRAAEHFDPVDDRGILAEIESHLAYLHVARDEYERARERANEALDAARDARARTAEAHALTQLGEVARYEREWAEARDAYERAARLYRSSGSKNVVISRLNRAIAEVGAGRIDQASELFEQVAEELQEAGLGFLQPVVDAGRACVAAADDERTWRRVWDRIPGHGEGADGIEKDVAWLLERTGRRAETAGHSNRAAAAYRRAAREWRALGDDSRADDVAERARRNAAT